MRDDYRNIIFISVNHFILLIKLISLLY